jgi:hypothetical protein
MADKRPTLPDVLGELLGKNSDGLRVCLPATVIAHNAGTGTATVQVMVSGQRNGSVVSEPALRDVPILGWGNLRAAVRPPILPGDPILLIFGDRDLDSWKAGRGLASVPAQTPRSHDLSDCVALPIMWGAAVVELFGFTASEISGLLSAATANTLDYPTIALVTALIAACNAEIGPPPGPSVGFATTMLPLLTALLASPNVFAVAMVIQLTALQARLLAAGITPA